MQTCETVLCPTDGAEDCFVLLPTAECRIDRSKIVNNKKRLVLLTNMLYNSLESLIFGVLFQL